MIKKFSQCVNENLTSLVDRYKNQGGTRKEDIIGNTDKLIPVDLGLSFYFANDTLCVDGEYYLQLDNYSNMNSCEWRFPTEDELKEFYDSYMSGKIYVKLDAIENKPTNTITLSNLQTGKSVTYSHIGGKTNSLQMYGNFLIVPQDFKISTNTHAFSTHVIDNNNICISRTETGEPDIVFHDKGVKSYHKNMLRPVFLVKSKK